MNQELALNKMFLDSEDLGQESEALIGKLTKSIESAPEVVSSLLAAHGENVERFAVVARHLLMGSSDHKSVVAQLTKLNVPSTVCGKAVDDIEFLWMCETCTAKKVESCYPCYCSACFVEELHKGHTYSYQLGTKNATCDCGDESWLVPASFCPSHRKKGSVQDLERFLPDYNKRVTPAVIAELQRAVQTVLCKGQDRRLIYTIYRLFRELIGISPAFIRMVTDSFFLSFPKVETTHCCTATTVEQARVKEPSHECRCAVIENLAKNIVAMGQENEEFSAFVTELERYSEKSEKSFADRFCGAFWKSYCYLFDESYGGDEERSRTIYKMLWQCAIDSAIPKKHIKAYYKNYISCFNYTIKNIRALDLDRMVRLPYYLMYDFYSFLNVDYYMGNFFLENADFFAGFVLSLAELEFCNNLTVRQDHVENYNQGMIREIPYTLEYFQRVFSFMIRGYDMKNLDINRSVFNTFKQGLKKIIADTPNVKEINSFNNPFLRSFSYFLNKFMYLNGNLDLSSAEYFSRLKETLVSQMGMSKEEFDSLAYEVLRRVFRVQNFAAEVDADLWVYYDFGARATLDFTYGIYRFAFAAPEVALIQNLLALLPPGLVNIEEMAELADDEKMLLKAQNDPRKLAKLRDRKWFTICYILFNTDCRLECYVNSLKEEQDKVDTVRADQLAKKMALRVLLQRDDKHAGYEHIDIDELVKVFPPFFRGKSTVKYLEQFLTKKSNFEYTVDKESLKYYDYAAYLRQKEAAISELILGEMQRKLKMTDFTLLQSPPKLKEDTLYQQAILSAVDSATLLAAFEKTQAVPKDPAKTGAKDLDAVNTSFLKIAYEVVCGFGLSEKTKRAFADVAKGLSIEEEGKEYGLYENAKKKIVQVAYGVREECKVAATSGVDAMLAGKAKERMEKIKKDFEGRMDLFAKKHMDQIKEMIVSTPSATATSGFDEICSICKEQLTSAKAYGRLCTVVSHKQYSKLMSSCFQKCRPKFVLAGTEENYISSEPNGSIRSCGHYMHLSCSKTSGPKVCPVCKQSFNHILPDAAATKETDLTMLYVYSLFENMIVDASDSQFVEEIATYVWKAVALGSSSALADTLHKRLPDLRCIVKFIRILREEWKPDEPSCEKAHLANVIRRFTLPPDGTVPNDDYLESCIADQLCNAVQWIYFKHAYASPGVTADTVLDTMLSLAKAPLRADVVDDIILVMTELCVLRATLCGGVVANSEYTSKLLSISESEDLQGKVVGLQKLLFPQSVRNVLAKAVEQLAATKALELAGIMADVKTMFLTLDKADSDYNKKVLMHMLGVTKGSVSLISSLPETFSAFQRQFFPQNCPKCNKHIREKYLCLVCGQIVCHATECCKKELWQHADECNCGAVVYIHVFYGDLIVTQPSGGAFSANESVYKTASQRDVHVFTRNSKSFSSKNLVEYKFSREAYQRWNNAYLTDRIYTDYSHL